MITRGLIKKLPTFKKHVSSSHVLFTPPLVPLPSEVNLIYILTCLLKILMYSCFPDCVSVVLYGCETWSLTQREERRLRVFENRVLRNICGLKGVEATGDWRRLHNEELYDLYPSPNIIQVIKSRRMRWVGHVARVEDRRGVHRVSVGRPEGKIPLGTLRRRVEDNIKILIYIIILIFKWDGGMDRLCLAQDRDRWRGACERGNEPSGSIKCGESLN
jgi:hypothetical protein